MPPLPPYERDGECIYVIFGKSGGFCFIDAGDLTFPTSTSVWCRGPRRTRGSISVHVCFLHVRDLFGPLNVAGVESVIFFQPLEIQMNVVLFFLLFFSVLIN